MSQQQPWSVWISGPATDRRAWLQAAHDAGWEAVDRPLLTRVAGPETIDPEGSTGLDRRHQLQRDPRPWKRAANPFPRAQAGTPGGDR